MPNPLTNERAHLPLSERILLLEGEVARLQSDKQDILDELKIINGKLEKMTNKIYMAVGAVGAVTWIIELLKH